MSDSFQSYVFKEKWPEGPGHFHRVKDWLLSAGVIESQASGDAAEASGHLPGAAASSILFADQGEWRNIEHNVVTFEVGRIVEASTELESGCCPDCNNDFPFDAEVFSPIGKALASYASGGPGELLCPHCARLSHVLDWDFGHGMAVGMAKVTFWNWPEHVPDLDERFFDLSEMWCTKVWGKL